jgi:hypothetical protein
MIFMIHEKWMPWATLGLMIWGCSSLGNGISKLLAANQMKRHPQLSGQFVASQPIVSAPQTSGLPQYSPPQNQSGDSTYNQAPSVTENTTRKLENPN